MKKIISLSVLTTIVLLFSGCGQNPRPSIYKWGKYSEASAIYTMYGEVEEVENNYKKELLNIIDNSQLYGKRVPPSIYAELGMIFYKSNKKDKAKKYFTLEKSIYPESTIFINNILNKLYGEL